MRPISGWYVLPRECEERLARIDLDRRFQEVYGDFLEAFLQPCRRRLSHGGDREASIQDQPSHGVYVFSVKSDRGSVYTGRLWDDLRIAHIAPADHTFTVPAWEWWLEPSLPRKRWCHQQNTLVFTHEISSGDRTEIAETVVAEGYRIHDWTCLKSPAQFANAATCAVQMIGSVLPAKLAADAARIGEIIEKGEYDTVLLVLRGGTMIRELLSGLRNMPRTVFVNAEDRWLTKEPLGSCLVVDDCVGTARTIDAIASQISCERLAFAALDATLPQPVYERHFPGISFFLPDEMLNIYGCRLFEENPVMIGIQGISMGSGEGSPLVRTRLLNNVRELMKSSSQLLLKTRIETEVRTLLRRLFPDE